MLKIKLISILILSLIAGSLLAGPANAPKHVFSFSLAVDFYPEEHLTIWVDGMKLYEKKLTLSRSTVADSCTASTNKDTLMVKIKVKGWTQIFEKKFTAKNGKYIWVYTDSKKKKITVNQRKDGPVIGLM